MTYEQETLWLAGWLEGEGHFCCRPNCNEIRIGAGSTDEDVVRHAAAAMQFPVRVYLRSGRPPHIKPLWYMDILGDRAVQLATRILPFMGQRRKAKIEFLLEKASKRVSRKESGRRGGLAKAAKMRHGRFAIVTSETRAV